MTVEQSIDEVEIARTAASGAHGERAGELRRALSVLKKRTGPHERTIRELLLDHGEVRVGKPLSEFEGVLTGVPSLIHTSAAREGASVSGD